MIAAILLMILLTTGTGLDRIPDGPAGMQASPRHGIYAILIIAALIGGAIIWSKKH